METQEQQEQKKNEVDEIRAFLTHPTWEKIEKLLLAELDVMDRISRIDLEKHTADQIGKRVMAQDMGRRALGKFLERIGVLKQPEKKKEIVTFR